MQKLLNDPDDFVDEALEGFVLAHAARVRQVDGEPRAVVRRGPPPQPRVAVATGGGFGHLPLFVGYVATGFADGCAVGNMFASPSTDVMLAVTRAVDAGRGVLYVYGNYGGDKLNFEAAAELAGDEDIEVETVRVNDDILSAPVDERARRRGIAGIWFAYAVAAAAVRRGDDLATAASVTRRAVDRTRSVGVALAAPILPGVGTPNFELAAGEMEIGTGIHGEPGVRRGPLQRADDVVDELMPPLLDELAMPAGAPAAVLINGLGATPMEELYIVYRRVHHWLTKAGVAVADVVVGEHAASLEMAGASISVLHLDDELSALLAATTAWLAG
ncbi:dihydroxyacetone kinase subunit DhaK [Desertimonas flava]|uniref:dihydroxyacetone kinase subunit DhaK n=1 Tax=Desertimonas flava TaxID=2064846 RepID=UPI000E341EE6|nr:dihydroxyacetone kinase subunit DhaK [Desertimonas flava]